MLLLVVANKLVKLGDNGRLVDAHPMGTIGHVCVAHHGIFDHRDALDDRVDSLGALDGVGDSSEQQVALHLNEVCLMVGNILFEVGRRVFPGKRVRVVAIGQNQHLHVHSFGQQHVGAS